MKSNSLGRHLITAALLISPGAFAVEPGTPAAKPLTEGSQTSAAQTPELPSDIVLRVANESNQTDGNIGPFTYGARANHTFKNEFGFEAGYIRLHEPGTPQSTSVLDEAQFTVKLPETHIADQTTAVEFTAWKNRMIDIYTDVLGAQITRKGDTSINFGIYNGSASLESLSRRFTGVQIGVSKTFGAFQLALGHLEGWMSEQGTYKKTSLEAAVDTSFISKLPITFTFAIEDRIYRFGSAGPDSLTSDRYIFVTGLELHFGELLF